MALQKCLLEKVGKLCFLCLPICFLSLSLTLASYLDSANSSSTMPKSGSNEVSTQRVLKSCLDLINSIPYKDSVTMGAHPVSLISHDEDGFSSARLVVATEIAPDLTIFKINTRAGTRKVEEIRNDPRVSLVWNSQKGKQGWLTVKGVAELGNEDNKGRLDITVVGRKIEVMSYNQPGLTTDGEGYKPVLLERIDQGSLPWKLMTASV
eukprot:TRINITY_DN111685_c0_g1_i1.p1 TRINITY_DN111685_c0_g1~~TRINITY_DN111685_c0_g1_i1.p1  ORF type:complete len:208 (-),score=10.09 TRINITY_DN111685_c0_g1_i1:256-879(-)